MDSTTIDLGICRLRPFRLEDAVSIASHADDRGVWLNLRDRFPHPYTLEDAQSWIEYALSESLITDFAIEVNGEAVGSIGYTPDENVSSRSAELGYWLGRAYWGRGIASAAVRALTDQLLAGPSFDRLHATVFAWNAASARVLEKTGFVLEGRMRDAVVKDGRTTDGLLYAIVRS
jgi:[ribosomal protein S5]-alanine N-acetyltransferase